MKIKNLLLISAASLMAIGLASCGGGNVKTDKFTISISARSSAVEQGMLKIWKKAYEEKHPEVEIKIDGWGSVETSQAYVQRYALNRSALTNIIYTTDDTTALLAQKENFVDLRKYYEADPETDYTKYYATMLDTTSFNGKFKPTTSYTGSYECDKDDSVEYGMYFAPREYNMPGLILNVDRFNEYGIPVPDKNDWNWNKFIELLHTIDAITVQKINDKSGDWNKYNTYRGIEFNQTWEPVYTSFMKELGGDGLFAFDDDYEASCNLLSPANVQAFKTIAQQFGNNNYKYAIDRDYSSKDFVSGNVFMAAVSYPEVGNYNQSIKNIAFLPFPTEYVSAGCGGYGILTDKEDEVQTNKDGEKRKTVDLCWDFIKFIISEEGQNIAGKEGYIQPVIKELAETGDWNQSFGGDTVDHSAFYTGKELPLDTFTFATPDKRNPLRNDMSTLFNKIFAVDVKEADVESILNNIKKTVDSHLKN